MYSLILHQPGEEVGGSTWRGRPGGTELVGLGSRPALSVPETRKGACRVAGTWDLPRGFHRRPPDRPQLSASTNWRPTPAGAHSSSSPSQPGTVPALRHWEVQKFPSRDKKCLVPSSRAERTGSQKVATWCAWHLFLGELGCCRPAPTARPVLAPCLSAPPGI